jgi:succinate dehydrogenase/fumarate reductase flavoprotein subunit
VSAANPRQVERNRIAAIVRERGPVTIPELMEAGLSYNAATMAVPGSDPDIEYAHNVYRLRTVTDYADEIARKILQRAESEGVDIRRALAQAAREGYALGYAAGGGK